MKRLKLVNEVTLECAAKESDIRGGKGNNPNKNISKACNYETSLINYKKSLEREEYNVELLSQSYCGRL